jgi:hypothetical protein
MNETVLYAIGAIVIGGVGLFLFKSTKKGIKKTKELRKNK